MALFYKGKEFHSLAEFHNCITSADDWLQIGGLKWKVLRTILIKCKDFSPTHTHYIILTLKRGSYRKEKIYIVERSAVNSCLGSENSMIVSGFEDIIDDILTMWYKSKGYKVIYDSRTR